MVQIKIHTVNMTAGMPAGSEEPGPVTFDDEGDKMLLLQVGRNVEVCCAI